MIGTGLAPEGSAAIVTPRFMTPMPVSRAAWRTIEPDGARAARGRVHDDPAAQRAVIDVTVRGRFAPSRSVQPLPLPRPSGTVTGTCTAPLAGPAAGADLATSLPGAKLSSTTIVPAPAGPAVRRAAETPMRMRRSTRSHPGHEAGPRQFPP